MKVSNETKVGVLAAIAITFIIMGFSFLKGRSLFKTGFFLYAKYTHTKGIMVSNPVFIKGFQVGSVYDIEAADGSLQNIVVAIKLKGNFNIPKNSVAIIKDNPLGTPSIDIIVGDDKQFLKSGDTLLTQNTFGLLGELTNTITPVTDQLKTTMSSLDAVIKNLNSTLDPNTKNNLQEVIANLNKATASLATSSVQIQKLLNEQNGAITQSMNNLNSFSKNLANNNQTLTNTLQNLETTTEKLSKVNIEGTVNALNQSVATLNTVLQKIDSKEGSLGLLVNDKELYLSLQNTVRSMNILMDDLKTHPKRYVSFSIFGRKDKSTPLSAPLADSIK